MRGFYRQTKNRRFTFLSPAPVAVIVLVVILSLVHLFAPGFLGGTLRDLMHPLWVNKDTTESSLQIFLTAMQSKRALVERNSILEEELERVKSLQLQNQALREENSALRELWGNRKFESLVLASVLRRPPTTLYDTLLVDIGGNANVKEGNRVVVNGSIIIGTVSRVDRKVALITLFSTPGVLTEVFIGTSTASVTARGEGAGNFTIEVPRELGISVGETVSLLGSTAFPFGKVEFVVSTPTHPFEIIRL